MESQTRNLLRECSTGCKMAINSFNQMRDYVEATAPAIPGGVSAAGQAASD